MSSALICLLSNAFLITLCKLGAILEVALIAPGNFWTFPRTDLSKNWECGGTEVLLVGATMVFKPSKGLSSCMLNGGSTKGGLTIRILLSMGDWHNNGLRPKVGNLMHLVDLPASVDTLKTKCFNWWFPGDANMSSWGTMYRCNFFLRKWNNFVSNI